MLSAGQRRTNMKMPHLSRQGARSEDQHRLKRGSRMPHIQPKNPQSTPPRSPGDGIQSGGPVGRRSPAALGKVAPPSYVGQAAPNVFPPPAFWGSEETKWPRHPAVSVTRDQLSPTDDLERKDSVGTSCARLISSSEHSQCRSEVVK